MAQIEQLKVLRWHRYINYKYRGGTDAAITSKLAVQMQQFQVQRRYEYINYKYRSGTGTAT